MSEKIKHSEPLVRISKRDGMVWWQSWLVRIIAVIIALAVCSVIIIAVTGLNPIEVYSSMIRGSFGTARKMWIMLQNLAMLLCISLAVTPAFKMRFWNIGAEGQVLVGGLATAAVMFYVGDGLPAPLMITVMLAASLAASVIWALIPAFFKAKWGTNETLFTLMMNYVAIQLVSFCIAVWVPSGSNVMGLINQSSQSGWLPEIGGQKYLLNIIIVALLTVAVFIYLKYSKHGYEIAVVGESENTARYIGINVKRVVIRTMALSGAMCGLAGFLLVSGTNHTVTTTTAGGMGFTAIMVSWLGKFNAAIMVITSFIIVFLQRGAGEIATKFNLNQSVADILTGIILFFIIGCEFFVNYRINFRKTKEVK